MWCRSLKKWLGNEPKKGADMPIMRAVVVTVAGREVKFTKPSAFESEIHPSHKLRLYSVYFVLLGATSPIIGHEFVNGCLCTHSQWQSCHDTVQKRGVAYSKKFIYTDVKINQSERQN